MYKTLLKYTTSFIYNQKNMNISVELRKKVETVFEQLDGFKNRIEKFPYGYKKREFFKIMEEFHVFLASFEDEELCEMVLHSEKYEEYKKFFRGKNDYFMRAVETVEALDIISKKVGVELSLLDFISAKFLKEVFLNKGKELQSLEMKGAKKMVFVGSGPLPDTCLYVYENTDIPTLIGLDYNEEAIYISSQFIENLGFNDRIHLECMDGCKYNYADADIVYIAGFVPLKHEILDQIAKTSTNPDVQILVDSTSGMSKLLFEDINEMSINKRLKIDVINSSKSKLYSWKMIKITKYDI